MIKRAHYSAIIGLMKAYTINQQFPSPSIIQEAVRFLRLGKVIAHPTDTCYGLAVDVHSAKGLKRLYSLKKMPIDKPVSILVRSLEEARRYGEFCELSERMAMEFWPGPLTLVVPRKPGLPDFLNPGAELIGLRVIDEPVSLALLEELGGPITTTSANLHGEKTPFSVDDFTVAPDLVLDVGCLRKHEKPSTVIKIADNKATTLRQGDLFEIYKGFK